MSTKRLTIRDAIHGDIEISDNIVAKLIDSFEFQRLRHITQLGGGQFVFPSAYHTRFSHSLGTYYIINQILQTADFSNLYDEHAKLLVKLAGLLHDIGHGPFSHTFEVLNNIAKTNFTHEQYSSLIIKSPSTEVNQILLKVLSKKDLEIICQLIEGKYQDDVLNSLVSSQLDADRLDYLLRDSITSGVGYSTPDIAWIIRHIKLENNKIIFPQKVQYAIESYLVGRYHMYKQIYYHPVSIGFDLTFQMIFQRLYDLYHQNFNFVNKNVINIFLPLLTSKMFNINDYCSLDDYTFYTYITMLASEKDFVLQELVRMFTRRQFLKIQSDQNKIAIIKTKLQKKYQADYHYFFINYEKKPFATYNKNDKPIYLEINNEIKRLDEISAILQLTTEKDQNKNYCYFTARMIE